MEIEQKVFLIARISSRNLLLRAYSVGWFLFVALTVPIYLYLHLVKLLTTTLYDIIRMEQMTTGRKTYHARTEMAMRITEQAVRS